MAPGGERAPPPPGPPPPDGDRAGGGVVAVRSETTRSWPRDVGAAATLELTLEDAAYKGYLTEVSRMLERGADVNAADTTPGGYAWSPLNAAAAAGHKQVVELLVRKRADVNAANAHGNTPLHSAAARGHLHVVRFLAELDEQFWLADVPAERASADAVGWVAEHDHLLMTNQGGKTAAELANEQDHDHVKHYLDERAEELEMAKQRREGTNRRL